MPKHQVGTFARLLPDIRTPASPLRSSEAKGVRSGKEADAGAPVEYCRDLNIFTNVMIPYLEDTAIVSDTSNISQNDIGRYGNYFT